MQYGFKKDDGKSQVVIKLLIKNTSATRKLGIDSMQLKMTDEHDNVYALRLADSPGELHPGKSGECLLGCEPLVEVAKNLTLTIFPLDGKPVALSLPVENIKLPL